MTEGIVEEVSGAGFDIMLGLSWTEEPLWHSIYGGWSYATGHATAGSPLAGGLLTQLTDQFMAGGTMGWFTYQDQKGAFLEPANAGRVEYIRKLSQARIVGKPWMVHGRATRTLLLNDASGSLKGGCFLRDKQGEAPSVACAIASPEPNGTATFSLAMAPARYGLVVPAGSHVVATDLMTGASLGRFPANVTLSGEVPALGVRVLKLAVEK